LAAVSPAAATVSIDPLVPVYESYPWPEDASVGVAITITVPIGDAAGTSVTFGPQVVYIPYERRGKWEVRTSLSAELDLFEWYVFQNRVTGPGPLKLKADFRADPPAPVPDNLKFGWPGLGGGIDVILPLDSKPKAVYWTELTYDLGKDWYKVEMPLLHYSWDTEDGSRSSFLGVSLNLYAPQGGCQDIGGGQSACRFTESWLDVTGGIPEPQTWAMLIMGFGLVGWRIRLARAATDGRRLV
jgi:hypothetical protein